MSTKPQRGCSIEPGSRYARMLAAFTLIELMIVVSIMGVVLTMGVPIFYRMRAEAPLRSAVRSVMEVCGNARRIAIFQSKATCVVFHPREGTFAVQGGAGPSASGDASGSPGQFQAPTTAPNSGLSGQLSDHVVIEMLDVDLTEYKDAEEVKVWFYPNGVCDELTLILFDPSVGHDPRRVISLEVTTGLAFVELDPRKLITSRR